MSHHETRKFHGHSLGSVEEDKTTHSSCPASPCRRGATVVPHLHSSQRISQGQGSVQQMCVPQLQPNRIPIYKLLTSPALPPSRGPNRGRHYTMTCGFFGVDVLWVGPSLFFARACGSQVVGRSQSHRPGLHRPRCLIHSGSELLLATYVPVNSCAVPRVFVFSTVFQ